MNVTAFDLLLRGQHELDRRLEDPTNHVLMIRKLLALALLGIAAHGFAVGLAADLLASDTFAGPAVLWMPIAFISALIGGLLICLPSFYFYTRLSGLDATFRIVTAQALRTTATTALYLLGALPIFLSVALASVVNGAISESVVFAVGFSLPFIVGLSGLLAAYKGFKHMLTYVDLTHARRGGFLLRMLSMWAIVYTAIAPVALFRAVQQLQLLF